MPYARKPLPKELGMAKRQAMPLRARLLLVGAFGVPVASLILYGTLADVKTVEGYCDWMYGLGTITAPGAAYDLHASCYDEATRTAVFFATYHAKHTGEGGPVPPTHKET